MNVESQAAYLLHSRPYQENKLLVELLTENDGKVAAVTYASQSKKSNKKALLQPFLPLSVELAGKHQLKSLRRVEATGTSHKLAGNSLYCGFYLNELMVRLLPETITCQALYQTYVDAIERLSLGDAHEPLLRQFELALLEELGFALDFSQAASYNSEYVSFNFDNGFEPALKHQHSYLTQDILTFGRQEYSQAAVLITAKRLMRNLINQLLGHKPLNSRKLFEKRE